MPENNEVSIEIETKESEKPDFLIDESEEETEKLNETEERSIETVEAELEALKEDLKKQLEAVAESERQQFEAERDRLLRTVAESENSKKRIEIDVQKQLKYANKNLIESLIPVLDSLEAAIKSVSVDNQERDTSSEITRFSEGVQLVQKQLLDVLKTNGLTPIEAIGGPFNPNQHEAVFATESDDVPEGDVIEEFRGGYQLHDQILRAAQVIVSKGKPKEMVESEDIDTEVTDTQQEESTTENSEK